MPVTSAVHYFTSGSTEGALMWIGHGIDNYIKDMFKQQDTKDVGQGENIPTVTGSKNRSGANQPIPLLIGETLYTPITLAQSYTDINPSDGTDGENQYFHCLYCLGYNDIDLKSVSLGIYKLSIDEHNGTSGNLDCQNQGQQTITGDRTIKIDSTLSKGRNVLKIPVKFDGYETLEVNSITSRSVSASMTYKVAWIEATVSITISSVVIQGTNIVITTQSIPSGAYARIKGSITVNCTIKEQYSHTHYPYADDPNTKRKGYYQYLELQQGEDEVSLYPQKVVQENFGTELMHPENVDGLIIQPFSAKYPQKIQLEVQFQNLVHFNDKGEQENMSVELCVGYSLDGGITYLPFNAFQQSSSAISVTNQGTETDAQGTYRVTRFSGHKNKAMRFIAEMTFDFATVFNIPDETVKVKNNVIEFKIWRKTVDKSVTDSKYQSKVSFSAIRTWCYDYKKTYQQYLDDGTEELVPQRPIIEKYRNMTARLGFSIRAGEEISGTLNELNVVMESRARTCTITEENGEKTYTWSTWNEQEKVTAPTNNPASLALLILQHPMRGEYAYTDDDIDLESFGKFYEWCEQTDFGFINSENRKYTANGVMSRQTKTIELANQILNCGHGKLVINGNKYGVLFDKPDDMPVMILNNQNVLEAKNTKNFDEDIDGYSCKFVDCINDYQEDTQIFVPKDLTDPTSPHYKDPSEYKLESIELPWITDAKRAYRMCMYMLACRKLRPETWERKLGVDGALVDVGRLVTIQDDTIAVGIGDGAQITEIVESSGDIVSIKVDFGFNVVDTTKTYGVKIQHSDAINGVSVRTYELASFLTAGTKDVLTFAEPIDGASVIKPSVNDIVSFGIYEKITTDAICLSKKSNNDGTYTLTLVPYQNNIYDAELGEIPEFVSNVTSPKDAGVEVSEELPPVTRKDVNEIAEAVVNEGSDTPPDAPTSFTITPYEDYMEFSCVYGGDSLKDSVKYFEFEITRGEGEEAHVVRSASNKFIYLFDRSVDGYPEAEDLADWTFRVRVVNIYDVPSATWCTGSIPQTALADYGTWKIPQIRVDSEVTDRTVILTAVYGGSQKVYGKIKTCVKVKRVGNTDEVSEGVSFNDMLVITPDAQFYKPKFDGLVQTDKNSDNEPNYREDSTEPFESVSNKITHTLPLIGQTYRIFKQNNIPVTYEDAEEVVHPVFSNDVPDVSEVPQNPEEGDVIHWIGDDYYVTTEVLKFAKFGYYLYENSDWTQVYSKAVIVPTTYQYEVYMVNESGIANKSNTYTASIVAQATNIADVVHSHEHYKDLYVEKLSAINANIGLISQGGMGSFADALNYWALSDLSAEDSGVLGGVKKGAFRVGGVDQYFEVMPDPEYEGHYLITLQAGNITLTSGSDASFKQGTYIYDKLDPTKRLALTSTGIIAQQNVSQTAIEDWQNMAEVRTDELGNMIITNADDTPEIGVQANGTIYHFEDSQHPFYEEGGTSNPEDLSGDGVLISTENESPIIKEISSPKCFNGTIEKEIGGNNDFVGTMVFFSKSNQIKPCEDQIIKVNGTVEDSTSKAYNDLMSEPKGGSTVGDYLGLTATQIANRIFTEE